MTEAVIAVKALKSKYWNEEKQKFVTSKQFKDENGLPIGPVQYFEADTLEELLEKKDNAHENASVALYKTRQKVKLGEMLEPDPEEPILTFEPRQLTADERVKLTKDLSDPAKAADAHRLLLEAELGAPIETVRANLRENEIAKRVTTIQAAIAQFKRETPEYVESESNSDNMKRYMEKHNLRYSAKNLKIAFEDLSSDSLLTVRAPKAAPTTPAPVTPVAAAPATPEVIPPAATTTPVIPVQSTEVRPKLSSSGLGRENSTATPGAEPTKTLGITIREVNAMSASEYNKRLQDPEFRKAIEKLYEKK
jgi:hypothetical protein